MAKCRICKKSVYPMDPQINLDGGLFHKPCAKCADCNCQITLSNFVKVDNGDDTLLLCKTHSLQRFHEKGSYLGAEKFKVKAERDVQAMNKIASFTEEGPNKGLKEEDQKISVGSVKCLIASSAAPEEATSAVKPANVNNEDDEKPPTGTIKEIQRRLSMSKEPSAAGSAPAKTLADLVPDMNGEAEGQGDAE